MSLTIYGDLTPIAIPPPLLSSLILLKQLNLLVFSIFFHVSYIHIISGLSSLKIWYIHFLKELTFQLITNSKFSEISFCENYYKTYPSSGLSYSISLIYFSYFYSSGSQFSNLFPFRSWVEPGYTTPLCLYLNKI